MPRGTKAPDHVVLFVRIPAKLSDALRLFAFAERRAVADLAREALAAYVRSRGKPPSISVQEGETVAARPRRGPKTRRGGRA